MDELAGTFRCTVLYRGVPIGSAELPSGRKWAGGLLVPSAGFSGIAGIVERARDRGGIVTATKVLGLPPGDSLSPHGLSAEAFEDAVHLATLTFELRDMNGEPIATDCVRIADPGDKRGPIVRAYFSLANAMIAAVSRVAPRNASGGSRGV